MRIAIIGPPFIEIPPRRYGGTELFIGNLAAELHARGHHVVVYGNGESRLPCRVKWRYAQADWPIHDAMRAQLKNADHTSWAMHDAMGNFDVIHLNDIVGVPFTPFVDTPVVLTVHHPHEPALSDQYMRYPGIDYVAIAKWLAEREPMSNMHVVHHGIPLANYTFSATKEDYVAFLGRMAPCKGPHLAIAAARRAGLHIKLAGEIQPTFREYWERDFLPLIDGRSVEYIGEADRALKNTLLSRARAVLFPIQWEEPFGLVVIEAMACGTPVLAFAGGSIVELIRGGVSGWVCGSVEEMADRAASPGIDPASCRAFVEENFSIGAMADR